MRYIARVVIITIAVGTFPLLSVPAEAGNSKYNSQLNAGARATQRSMNSRPVEIKPNTMGGYNVRQGHQNLGTVKPDGMGGYRYEESWQQRNPLKTPGIPIK